MSAVLNRVEMMERIQFEMANEYNESFETRSESRVKLQFTLYVRRAINNIYYMRAVKTEDVSYSGARFISDLPLQEGAELQVSGLKGEFAATATVRHITRLPNGKWSIGINFIRKQGQWVIR